MKIVRLQTGASPSWAVLDPDDEVAHLIGGSLAEWARVLLEGGRRELSLSGVVARRREVRMLAPLDEGARVLGVGANYRTHLERLGAKIPSSPVVYLKPDSAIIGPGEEIRYPVTTAQLDYEVELVAVVGRVLSPEAADPTECLLGYTIGNDVSARDAKSPFGGPDLYGMKALDATTPVGPWIVTRDELGGDGQPSLPIRLRVNGEERQSDDTSNMIWSIGRILQYLNARTALRPGDLVFTGTTSGVGLENGRFLEPGDVVEAEIGGIGILRNVVGPRS